MKDIEFFVEGTPKAQARPCAFYNKKTGRAGVYDKGTSAEWKSKIAEACIDNNIEQLGDKCIHLALRFYMPRPKNHYVSSNISKGKKRDAPFFHASRPDLDNLEKAVMDAMTDRGVWQDDSFVCSKASSKVYANEKIGVNIIIHIME